MAITVTTAMPTSFKVELFKGLHDLQNGVVPGGPQKANADVLVPAAPIADLATCKSPTSVQLVPL
jgi:hypothetical protein